MTLIVFYEQDKRKSMTLKNIPFGSLESFNVILEISKGSPFKYEYDHEKDTIVQEFVFKDGFLFKYNYGFVPETMCGDGDPQDVMILNNKPLEQGKIYQCRAVGIIELLDRGEEDNKLRLPTVPSLPFSSI